MIRAVWHHVDTLLCTALQEAGDLARLDELRSEEVWRHQEHRHAGLFHGGLDLREALLTGLDETIVPGAEEAVPLKAGEVRHEAVFPGLVLVAVAEEDGRGHTRMLAGFDGWRWSRLVIQGGAADDNARVQAGRVLR